MSTPAQPASRLQVPDPKTNAAIQDIYNKLNQVQALLTAQNVKAGTYTITANSKITVNAQGQLTSIIPA